MGIDSSYFNRVLACCERYDSNMLKMKNEVDLLNENEINVLKYVADGYKRKEVAKELYVSLAWVNKVMESIYKKFEVNNKTAAIQKAREFKII